MSEKMQLGSPEHLAALRKAREAVQAGYGGVLSTGEVVDRRERPEAMPMPANSYLGIPLPKPLPGDTWRTGNADGNCER